MLRPRYELKPAAQWSADESYDHLSKTFDQTCREFPDLMDRYLAQLELDNREHNIEVMRRGLRETVKQRYPDSWPQSDDVAPEQTDMFHVL